MGFWKKILGLETTASTAATAMSTTMGLEAEALAEAAPA